VPVTASRLPSRTISGIIGVNAKRPMPIAMASATRPMKTIDRGDSDDEEWGSIMRLDSDRGTDGMRCRRFLDPRSRRAMVAGVVAVTGMDIMATRCLAKAVIGASVQRPFTVEVGMDSEPVKSYSIKRYHHVIRGLPWQRPSRSTTR